MTVSYKDYDETKRAFFEKHDYDFKTETSPLDEYDRYHKEYVFEDGAIWYEIMTPMMVPYEVEVKLVKVRVEVKMLQVEFWSSDDAASEYYYEKY